MIKSVIIVGGGASAVAAAVALAGTTNSDFAPTITVVSRDAHVGLGIAYGRADAHHLLNSPAGKMSITAASTDNFVRWAASRGVTLDPRDFAPRRLYGEYLSARFAALADSGRVTVIHGDVVALESPDGAARIALADGRALSAEVVVLALGNPPPAMSALDAVVAGAGIRVIPDPWVPDALDSIHPADRVLLIGAGLTMVDIATSLARRLPGIRLAATSRHLLLPQVHPEQPAPATGGVEVGDGPATLGDLVSATGAAVRKAHGAGIPWQAVVDGMRPQLNSLWRKLSVEDRRRFISRLGRTWEVHRHRMAPAVHAELQRLRDAGTLELIRSSELKVGGFDVVVNCTGPRAFSSRGWSALVDSMLSTGLAEADELGLGLKVDGTGALIASDGAASARVFAIGPALRGTLYETTAIPEICQEATALAAHLADLNQNEPRETVDAEGAR